MTAHLHLPTDAERLQAKEALARLQREAAGFRLVDLPAGVAALVENILDEVAQGRAVQVIPVDRELSSQTAADLLGVSRPHLNKLLDAGKLAYWKVGTHRRVRLADVLVFREQRGQERQQALQELADLDQELGML
ncbi:excisionase family DNA-binding protein [Deinococcus sp.]|uniref:excisionase family DNA-binding protein n=1 Tax=Deinococcus sp. TaxID=47478 RepID=UPI0025CD15B9|nr:excisionase family DNA-binding protein [Deinococcus sp.]